LINLQLNLMMVLLTVSLGSCTTNAFEITDHIRVYRYAESNAQGNSDDSNVLMCKLGGEPDPYISNVKIIQWNQTYMIVETFTAYFLVDGSKNKVCCMCKNLTKGPYNQQQISQVIDSIKFIPDRKIDVYKHMKRE